MADSKTYFIEKLSEIITSSVDNDYRDNFDFERFNGVEKLVVNRKAHTKFTLKNIDLFADACSVFSNQESRDLYVILTAFKMLGHRKVKLPVSCKKYFETRQKLIDVIEQGNDTIDSGLFDWKLYLTDLQFLDLPIQLYTRGSTVCVDHVVRQYEYASGNVHVAVQPGDTVIDAGACWGNTALYFAHRVGPQGKVYSFEFTNNTDIFKRNISLNPSLAEHITLIEKALWDKSNEILYFDSHRPGTNVRKESDQHMFSVTSLSIDDFMDEYNIQKVDFIKMDIEGAEQKAIEGAVQTLKKHKPRLAITIYHGFTDYINIPRMLRDMNLGYKFYLKHGTVHKEETVLFGKA